MYVRPTEVQTVVVHASCAGAPADALVHRHTNTGFDGDAAAASGLHLRVSICVLRLILSAGQGSVALVSGQWNGPADYFWPTSLYQSGRTWTF